MSQNANILIVDDTVENLRVLGDMLRRYGYKVRPVTSGALALKACVAQPPDLILLDIAMPEMDGFEVCAQLKQDAALKDLPVLFISAHTESDHKVKAFLAGGVDYITKPFNVEEVAARVATHLALHRQTRELKENYDRIRDLEETRKHLTRMIVHDLRNPLMAVKGYLEIMEMRNPGLDAASKQHMRSAQDASRQLLDLANSLLDLNCLEEGQMKLNIESVDLGEVCREAVTNSSVLMGERKISVECSEVPRIADVDRYLMLRIIQNILGNALKFTDKKTGVVTLRVETLGDNVVVSIIDNGPGIPKEYHQRIFERFVQVEGTRIPGVHSTGLGLSLVKLGTEAHGGNVSLESEPGKGTTFRISVPRVQPTVKKPAEETPAEATAVA